LISFLGVAISSSQYTWWNKGGSWSIPRQAGQALSLAKKPLLLFVQDPREDNALQVFVLLRQLRPSIPLRLMMMTGDQVIVPEALDSREIFLLLPPRGVRQHLESVHHCKYQPVVKGFLWKRET